MRKRCVLFWIIFVVIVSGCQGTSPSKTTQTPLISTETAITSPTFTATTAPTISPQPTFTKGPTFTPRPITTKTPTLTLPPPTPTALPTLPNDEKETYILTLLETNAGCELPCWWGIQPGTASLQNHLSVFEPLGLTPSLVSNEKDVLWKTIGIKPTYSELGNSAVIIDVFEKDNVIKNMGVFISPDRLKAVYYEVFRKFSLQEFLLEHGRPTRVTLNIDPYTRPATFELALFYEVGGFVMGYTGPAGSAQDFYTVCPNYEILRRIRLHLSSPNDLNFVRPVGIKDGLVLEEVSNMDVDEFYNTFLLGETGCLETPKDIW